MNERLLQYIWQFQYFNKNELATTNEEPLQILFSGMPNTNQGPDFLNAKIKIGTTLWAGNIELHIKSSDWNKHKHTSDANYKNIILHVVWENDIDLGLPFSTLELNNKVSKLLLKKYEELMNATSFISCEKNMQFVKAIVWAAWRERLMVERLESKFGLIENYLDKNKHHWEETFWWMLAKNFGIKINSGAFEKMAQSLPVTLLAKHKNQLHQTEALLFGQAGLLEKNFSETYPQLLKKEYRFLQSKYKLSIINEPVYFLRMRPSNFPTVRLAQLAMLIHRSSHLFSKIKETNSLPKIKQLLNITANDYWHYHYLFDELSVCKKKNLGMEMINNILINTIVPVLFAYGHYNNEEQYKRKAILWLEQIAAEKNAITHSYTLLGIPNKNAFDSQSLIQLKNEYCNKKRCLECAIGSSIIRG